MALKLTSSERAVVPGRAVALSNDVIRVGRPCEESAAAGDDQPESKVELIRLGDRIQAIDVICSCGQRTRIRCVYDS